MRVRAHRPKGRPPIHPRHHHVHQDKTWCLLLDHLQRRVPIIGGHHRVPLITHKWCAHAFEQARGGSGAWYAMELTELVPHVARGLNINWDEAIRYSRLNAEF